MTTPQTPQASPPPHLDVDLLADLQEGLLDPERAAVATAHLAGCPDCRATRDALDGVRDLLRGDAGEVEAAPEDVVRRLDAALATASRPLTASATVTPLTSSVRQPWRTHLLQAAAIFVLVALVGGLGYGGLRALNHRGSAASDTAASASGGNRGTEKSAAGAYKITSSGRDYTQASLRAAVPELLAGTMGAHSGSTEAGTSPPSPAASAPSDSVSGSTPSPLAANPQRLRNGVALSACVANLAGGPVTPLAVDVGRFEGKPATIIVLPDPDDPSFVDVYAVSPDCAKGLFLSYQKVALP
jgi:Putative zinc-finger